MLYRKLCPLNYVSLHYKIPHILSNSGDLLSFLVTKQTSLIKNCINKGRSLFLDMIQSDLFSLSNFFVFSCPAQYDIY